MKRKDRGPNPGIDRAGELMGWEDEEWPEHQPRKILKFPDREAQRKALADRVTLALWIPLVLFYVWLVCSWFG